MKNEWSYEPQDIGADWADIVRTEDGMHIAQVRFQADNSQEYHCRLIAAAPKLLEALVYLKKHIECDKQDDVTSKAITIAEAAIAAAKVQP